MRERSLAPWEYRTLKVSVARLQSGGNGQAGFP